jgi:hypothetical protein
MPDIDERDRSTPVSKTEAIGVRAWLSLLAVIALLAVAIMMIPGGRENPRTAENQAPIVTPPTPAPTPPQ